MSHKCNPNTCPRHQSPQTKCHHCRAREASPAAKAARAAAKRAERQRVTAVRLERKATQGINPTIAAFWEKIRAEDGNG